MLIKCPECGQEVSDKAPSCIHCGYPLQSAPTPQKITTTPPPTKKAAVKRCAKCGAMYPADDEACPSCGKAGGKIMKEHHTTTFADERAIPVIKCPTCGSTDVERISTMTKAVNIWAFGLFGNKRNKQFKCNTCRYMW